MNGDDDGRDRRRDEATDDVFGRNIHLITGARSPGATHRCELVYARAPNVHDPDIHLDGGSP